MRQKVIKTQIMFIFKVKQLLFINGMKVELVSFTCTILLSYYVQNMLIFCAVRELH